MTRRRLADPHEAFRARVRRDRAKLLRLSAVLRRPIRWSRASSSLSAIEGLAHGLAGAGGIFGFAALGEDAARLERLLERWRLRPPAEISARRIAAFSRKLVPLLDHLGAACRSKSS